MLPFGVALSGDGTVRLWNVDATDAANGTEIRALRRHTDYAWPATLSGDGIVALSGASDGSLHLWNTATQPAATVEPFATTERDRDPAATGDVRIRVLPDDHTGPVYGVSLSADGRLALSGGNDGTVRLCDATTGTHLRTMTGHRYGVSSVSLSADGRLALSGSRDRRVVLWDATTGTYLRAMTGHTDRVGGVSLSADGRLALSGSRDGTVRLWHLGRSDDTFVPSTADANAGTDQSVASASTVTLDGSGSTDSKTANGKPIAYHWHRTAPAGTTLSAANTVTLSANNTERVTFTAPTVTSNTTLRFALTVTDPLGLVDTDEATITVTSASGSAPPSLTGTAPRGRLAATTDAHATTPTGTASRLDSSAAFTPDATSPASPACASADDGAGRALRGWMHGAHCVYPASLLGIDNPLETDATFPALPNGGAHIFQGRLVVGRARDVDANPAATTITTDDPMLTSSRAQGSPSRAHRVPSSSTRAHACTPSAVPTGRSP